jgi:hypothetical protein
MTEEENLENMRRCPRFESCNIPKCPLDYWMLERTELPDEQRCVLRGAKKSKRVKGIRSRGMGVISKFIPKKNQNA